MDELPEMDAKQKRELERETARSLHDLGHSFYQIGQMLGYTHTTIKTWCMPEYKRKRLSQHQMARNERRRIQIKEDADRKQQARMRRIKAAVNKTKEQRARGERPDVVAPVKGAKIGVEITRLQGDDPDPRDKTSRINGDPLPERQVQHTATGRYQRQGRTIVPVRNERQHLRRIMADLS